MKGPRWLQRLADWIGRAEDALLVLLLGAMIALAGSQILLRNFWDMGLSWGEPLLRVSVLWVGLLGAMAATRDRRHIRIDLLSRFLPPRLASWTRGLADLFAGLVCLLLAWHGARFVHYEWLDGGLLFGTVPAWACELIIPLAFALMGLRYLLGLGAPPSEDRP